LGGVKSKRSVERLRIDRCSEYDVVRVNVWLVLRSNILIVIVYGCLVRVV
jgi:hypothetical protein